MGWSSKRWRHVATWASMLALMATAGMASAAVPGTHKIPDTLQQRIKACTSCHGKHGQGGDNGFNPRLAGKPVAYLYNQLLNFREGRRRYPLMRHMVTGLSDTYLHEIAEYFAAQKPVWPAPAAPDLPATMLRKGRQVVEHGDAAHKVPACVACHGKRLMGLEPAIPPLVGLPKNYIRNQLGAWRGGTRQAMAPDCMSEVASRLTPEQITEVAVWLAAQPVPDNTRPAPAGSLKLPMKCGGMEK